MSTLWFLFQVNRLKGLGGCGTGTAWQHKHRALRKELGLDAVLLSESRVSDLIQLAEQIHPRSGGEKLNLFSDVSQDASRRPWSKHCLRSITTSSAVYAHDAQRLLIPAELFAALGFANIDLSCVSHNQAEDLVGECMSLPSVTACLVSLLVAMSDYWAT